MKSSGALVPGDVARYLGCAEEGKCTTEDFIVQARIGKLQMLSDFKIEIETK